jgi:hypothetical protein
MSMSGLKSYRPKFGFDIRISQQPAQRPKAAPGAAAHRCSVAGCTATAEWRAPRSRERMEERVWMCQEHLRRHNESWNYFAGMNDAEIEQHCLEAAFGHRPTWPMGKRGAPAPDMPHGMGAGGHWSYVFEVGFAIFEEAAEPKPRRPKATKGQLDALAVLNLEETATLHEIKARYKELVKRFHPDANGGDRGKEERLRQVIKAYGHLRTTGFARTAP